MEANKENLRIVDQLDVAENAYSALIEFIQEDVFVNDRVEASFHFIKYHDCINRERDFLSALASYLVYYCFPKIRYKGKMPHEIAALVFEGRNKFFNPKDSKPKGSKKGRSGSSRYWRTWRNSPIFFTRILFKSSPNN